MLDEDGLLEELNPKGEELLGWTAAELRGRNMHDAVHYLRPDGSPYAREECHLLAVLRSGEEFAETEDVFVRKNGSILPVAYVSTPVLAEGEIVGAVLAFWRR